MYMNMNKKSWRLMLGLLSITFLVFLFHTTSFSLKQYTTASLTNSPSSSEQAVSMENVLDISLDILRPPQPEDKMAFVTFLCDDVMGEASEVLVYSLKQTNTKHDIVVLVLDDVTQIVRKRLEYLGAIIIDVDQVKYPWDSSSARRKGFNKACRYSKLNLWNLTQYKKVVFLDADTMVVQPIDELFEYPQFTAVVDIGGALNTGVFVAEPSVETYQDIMNTYENAPSYNRGDQGFLNYYFNQSSNVLPGNYNLMIKFTHFSTLASSFVSKNTVKVLHFTSETKPWNFHFLHHREWRENYDGHLFGLWTHALRRMRSQLVTGDLWPSDTWQNKGRVEAICDHRLPRNYGRRYPKTNQFTVILNLNKIVVDVQRLQQLLRVYASSNRVAQVFINGNVIKDKQGKRLELDASYLRRLRLRKPIKAVGRGSFQSVNNKFNPIEGINTDAVYLADENVLTSLEDLEFAFRVWTKNMDSIVGFKPNAHHISDTTNQSTFIQNLDDANRYSMIESGSMFMKSDFLYGYTCLLPEEIHQYIDDHPMCHDIAINMLVSGMTGSSPVLVNSTTFLFEFQEDKSSSSHIAQSSQCINDLSKLFNGGNSLVFSDQIVSKASADSIIHRSQTLDDSVEETIKA